MKISPENEKAHLLAQQRMAKLSNYYNWILQNFNFSIGSRIWDAGAGIGNVVNRLIGEAEFILATELTPENIKILTDRFSEFSNVKVGEFDLTSKDYSSIKDLNINTIIILDVLEHIKDDIDVLSCFYEVLQPGGRLLIKVPAHPFLYGTIDKASLHYRRYSKNDLLEKMTTIGFQVEKIHYMNFLATIPYLLNSRIFKKTKNFSLILSPIGIAICNLIIPLFALIEKYIHPPFGLSLIAIAKKPLEEHGPFLSK